MGSLQPIFVLVSSTAFVIQLDCYFFISFDHICVIKGGQNVPAPLTFHLHFVLSQALCAFDTALLYFSSSGTYLQRGAWGALPPNEQICLVLLPNGISNLEIYIGKKAFTPLGMTPKPVARPFFQGWQIFTGGITWYRI